VEDPAYHDGDDDHTDERDGEREQYGNDEGNHHLRRSFGKVHEDRNHHEEQGESGRVRLFQDLVLDEADLVEEDAEQEGNHVGVHYVLGQFGHENREPRDEESLGQKAKGVLRGAGSGGKP
jgi:hypothetical protein